MHWNKNPVLFIQILHKAKHSKNAACVSQNKVGPFVGGNFSVQDYAFQNEVLSFNYIPEFYTCFQLPVNSHCSIGIIVFSLCSVHLSFFHQSK